MRLINDRVELLRLVPKNGICCEVGVLQGDYSQQILRICQPRQLFLVDVWMNHLDFIGTECKAFVEERFKVPIANGRIVIKSGLSKDMLIQFPSAFFDFVYIDASHDYQSVIEDLELSLVKTKRGGLIAGHDYCIIRDFGVVRAVAVFCDRHNLQVDYLTNEPMFPIKRIPHPNFPKEVAFNSYMIKV